MPEYSTATQLIPPGKTALVIFTDGRGLTDNHNGTASTGWWHLNLKRARKVDIVIICRRASKDQSDNDLFVGRLDSIDDPLKNPRFPGTPRCIVHLNKYEHVGHTKANWREFANSYMRPIRYLPDP